MDVNPISNESAVIVLIEEATNSLILTQRARHLRDHPGEICFPGGRWEAGDANFWITALRELKEELDIDAQRIRLIKQLQIEQTLNGSIIHPWLATISTLQPFTINPEEVHSIVKVSMTDAREIENYKNTMLKKYGIRIKSCQFKASNHVIWGATARIMKQLLPG